ncbi:hypothetical protein J4212_04830 [Candidatus Woesearchaeota archaeon]|nr:hypothetical protein [Candidatus Woesearchaeota archaeon]
MLILGTLPPITYGLQCQEDGITWGSCASLAFNDNFTAVRVNCTDPDGFILNATFNFTNVEDGKLFFKANASFNRTDTFIYNLSDIRIRDSGKFNVTATCIDNNNTKTTNRTSWSIAWGTLATSLVAPSSAVNVTRYQFFNFTAQLSCSGGECGFVNATLDPTVIHNETIVFESFESGTGGIFNTTKYPPVGAVALADASGGVASICAAQQGTLPNVLAGSYAIEISAGTDCGTFGQIQAEINATNYTDIRLNFSWSAADTESPNDQATLWVLINNSGSWQSIWSVIPNSNGATLSYSNVSLVLDDVMSNSPSTAHSLRFKFNFTSSSGGSTDEFYVDSFNVSGQRAEVSKGIVSTVEGEVPFFTISANPYSHLSKSCLADMGSGYACNVTWEVNATGGADTKWEFFVIGDAVNYSSYVSQDNSTSVNITIILNEPPSVSSVTLTPLQPSNATDLNCSFIVTDPNTFDTLTANVTWYKGGVFNNSRTLSVSNGAQSNSSLSFSQTNPGEQWKCGVIPFDEVEYGDQVNSSSVTILLNTPPVINSVQCEENGTTWESCRSILYTDRITRVRINCTSEVAMSNATFTLTNLPDGRVYFSNITIDRSADFFIFNNDDVKINDSGDFLLNASCTDESNITSANSSRWLVPWGTLSVSLVEPASDTTVQFNDFFTFTSRVSCVGGECGSINASIWRNSSFDFGFGESGALSVTSGNRVVNNYTFLILNTTAGSKHINVSNTTEFRAGDEILIVQMQNGTQGIAGKYEFNIISQASKNAINLTYGLSSSYFTSLFNTSNATAAQIVKVPHFTNVTVNSGASITAEPWNGQKGGIIIFRATGIVTVLGHINATAKGFRGGLGELGNGGLNGESFDGYVGSGGTDTASGTGGGNPGTDGGGGSSNYNAVSPSGTRGGGGGGGHVDGNANNDGSGGGAGGGYGGGGGGGGGGGDNNAGGSGGSGGSTGTGAGGGGTGTDGGAGASGGNAGNAGGGAVGGAAGSGSSTGQGGGSGSATANGIGAGGAGGGGIYGKSNLATLLPGSGGGAGGSHDNGPLRGQDGGAGGGIISIVAKKVVVTGTIQSNGQNGNATVNRRGASGAGAGGSVYLKAENLSIGTNLVSVTGGTGGAAGTQGGGGGSGGVGRIKLDYSSVSGSSNPAAGATGGTDAGLFVLVSTIGGDTPFYTTDKNPKGFLNQSCLKNLTSGNSCDVIWNINATGEIGSKWKFITKFNATTYPYNVTSKQTSSIVLTIQDATQVPPIVTLISPSTGHITNSPLLLFNCSATDNTQLKNMTLFGNFDGAFAENGTNLIGGVSNNTNFSRTLGEGQFIWNCRAYDTDNNVDWGNSNFTLTVDLTKPSFNISHPANNSNFTVGDIDFNFTVFDNFDALMLCNLTVNGTIYHQNFNANNGTLSSKQVTGLAQGIYVWNLTCVDDAGNVNTTALRRFNVIDLAPNTTLNAPSNNTMINSSTVVFLHTPTDNNNVTFARLILDGVLNQTNNSVTKDAINAFTVRNFNEGRHNWTVNVSDQTGLSYAAPLLFFTIDYKAPSINLTGPDDNYGFNTSSITLNFTVGDTVDSTLLCNLTINGSVADPLISANTGQIISRGLSNRPDGHFVWNVTCWDDANNTNTSASRHFNVSAKPSVSLSSPGANAVVGSPNISFLYTPTDNTNFSKCEFMFNGKLNHTNTTIFNSEVNNFTLYNLASGVYNWTVNCTDTIGLTALAATRNFTIDVVPPNITLKKPLQNATLYGTEVMFNFSASDDIDKFMLCNLTLNGQVNVSNINVPNATYANTTVVILTDGDYFWNITCIDDALNSNTSETRNFTMSVPPDVTLSSPESGTIINYTFNVSFAFLAFDSDGVPNATFILNGKANQTLFNIDTGDFNYFRINFTADGAYTWQVNATDPNGLVGTSSIRSFIIDTTPPNVTLNIPANNSVVTSNNVTFNFTASDFLDQIFLCNITIDGEVRFGDISVTNNSDTLRNFSLQDGEHNWSVLCIDNANNTNLIELHNFSVEAPPFVVLQYPADGSRSSSRNQSLNYTPYDIFGFSSCALLLNGALNQTDTSITADEMNAFAVENLTHGKYNWTSRCTDAAPDFNIYTPSNYTFYIDLLGPGIVLNYPADGQTLNTNDILFNFTPTDQFGFNTVLTCNITLDGVTNVSLINVTSGNYNETLVTNLADGSHTWNVTCKDDLNNTNTSLSATFIINQPDLYINDSLVIVNNSQPREGDNVTINATIFNIGGIPATNVLVRFYDRNPNAGGEQIDGDRTIPSIDITKNVTVNVTWKAQIGDYEIFVIVDPLKAVSELNETNNNASRNVSISMWHIINGNLTGNLVIQSLGNSTVFLWDTTDGTAGNVFVIDTDSSIIWANLTAIGRNTTGGNASNDWGEIDSALQTSNYSDSVNRTFLAGEVPLNLTTFIIYTYTIENVSVANSTNNSVFTTGVMWDRTDDAAGAGHGEYNGTEDIVFATAIKRNQLGKYGNYDFEMRVPSALKSYKQPQSSVTFFVELR